jgi:hypothetical protein
MVSYVQFWVQVRIDGRLNCSSKDSLEALWLRISVIALESLAQVSMAGSPWRLVGFTFAERLLVLLVWMDWWWRVRLLDDIMAVGFC